jgi:thermitase
VTRGGDIDGGRRGPRATSVCAASCALVILASLAAAPALAGTPPLAAIIHAPPVAHVADRDRWIISSRVIVTYRPGAYDAATAALRARHARIVMRIPSLRDVVVSVPGSKSKNAVAAIAAIPGVAHATPDVRMQEADADCTQVTACVIPNDPYFTQQWYLENDKATITEPSPGGTFGADIDAPLAWAQDMGSASVKIAIVDSGIDPNQPDVAPRVVGSTNVVDSSADTSDSTGHGTAVAGVAAAIPNNGIGIAGVAWNASLLNIKTFTDNGTDTESCSALAAGIMAAVNDGARVINVSAGSPVACSPIAQAVSAAWNAGDVVVAAAGNYASTQPFYPAAYPNVVSVAATDANDQAAPFTDTGASWVDLAAPGVDILTTLPTYTNDFGLENYGYVSGTSFATPMVSGAAALLFAEGLSNTQVVAQLFDYANPIAGTGTQWRYGLLDVCAAIAAGRALCPPPNSASQSAPTPTSTSPPTTTAPAAATPAPAPKAKVKAKRPPAGTWTGHTAQGQAITFKLAANAKIELLSFGYAMHCAKAPDRVTGLSMLATSATPITLDYLAGKWGFAREIGNHKSNYHYLVAQFASNGDARGWLTVDRFDSHGGLLCGNGKVKWTAKPSKG